MEIKYREIWDQLYPWLSTSGLRILVVLVGVWASRVIIMYFLARAIKAGVRAKGEESSVAEEIKREETLISLAQAIIRIGLYLVGLMIILSEFNIDIGPLIAGASFAGVAIGFGAQSLVKDFVAGMFLILENQYRVGDIVSIAGVSGRVESITVRQTVLRNLDGHQHHIPNGIVDVATNMTMTYSNINLDVGVGYDSDIAKVEKIINAVGQKMLKDKDYADNIIKPPAFVRVKNFGPSSVDIKILGKVTPGSQWSVGGEFRRRLKIEFDKNNIEIPFDQVVMHQAKTSGTPKPSATKSKRAKASKAK